MTVREDLEKRIEDAEAWEKHGHPVIGAIIRDEVEFLIKQLDREIEESEK